MAAPSPTVGEMLDLVGRTWERDILPALADYIAIPALSPSFEPAWEELGHIEAAVEHVRAWMASRPINGLTVDVHRIPGLTPVVVAVVEASPGVDTDDTVLLYGHLDKQPPMDGWLDGLGPFTPVRRGDLLYGRGGADDGYSGFAALAAIEAVQAAGGSHGRCVVLIEGSEESGSPHLQAHVEALAARIGEPSLVVCLDSGCATYDRLWVTTSLRGLVGAVLRVQVLGEGMHSGAAGGVVPSSFRLVRQLLDRIEDARTGALLVDALHAEPPPDRVRELAATAAELGADAVGRFPVVDGLVLQPGDDHEAALRAQTWEPSLSIVGAAGLPAIEQAGNVQRTHTSLKLSFRLPPTVDPATAAEAVRTALVADPPNGAAVTLDVEELGAGWNAPAFEPWLADALDAASDAAFGQGFHTMGEGGSIPFMAMLGERFPRAQFVVTGVLGPGSNAHGPNEFLHVPCAVAVTTAVAQVLGAHAGRPR